jgi:pimeloyl-ACP methyl ester carboxylesterase
LRGLTREQRHWWSFPERLAKATKERVVCLDLPGFGAEHARRSPSTIARITEDVRERFEKERGGEPWAVLGISLGGMVALDWCARHRDFTRCVTINTSARPSGRLERFRLSALRSLLIADADAREHAVLRLTTSTANDLDTLVRKHGEWRREFPPMLASVVSQLRAATRFEVPSKLHTPLLVLTSNGDRLVSHRCSERIAAHLGAELATHEGGGHDLPLDAPDWICAQIQRWSVPNTDRVVERT